MAVQAAYKLGMMDGQNTVKVRLNVLQAANHTLWESLVKLDEVEAVDFIRLSIPDARKLILALRQHKEGYFARKLKKLVDENQKSINELYKKYCDGLSIE